MLQSKKKKQPKNAFYFFMVHFRNLEEAKGVKFHDGWKDVSEKAGPIWKNMHPDEKWIYEEEARKARGRDKNNLECKFTSQGKSFAQVEREKNEAYEQNIRMTQEIEGTVRSLDISTSLPTYPFHLIHVNYYCRQENGMYTPCEVALSEFTLMDGVRKVYHTLINPGNIPLGYKYEAERQSAETHQIPVPPEEFGGETDYVKILLTIKQFLTGPGGSKYPMPPLYTQPNCEDVVKNVLYRLEDCIRTDYSSESDTFRVYPLPKLFYELRNACISDKPGAPGFPVYSLAERELERDVFSFTQGISCKFHDGTDAVQHCSLSYVRRWGFIILDHCCKDLGIELIPGEHCPRHADTARYKRVTSRPSSVATDVSSPSPNLVKKPDFVDCGRLSHDPSSVQDFMFGDRPEIVSSSKQPDLREQELVPLRQPNTDSIALSLLRTQKDIPSPGSSRQNEMAGVKTEEPVAVVGRGKLRTEFTRPISLGRGQGLLANLEMNFENMKVE
ncbi:hypothetical protein B7P43_G01039 [Cryptotermes secundus]|uniref:HMG box domain-containing protein n=1 Tax=Cryptotermes secundus TaxID=105785 RepID=A0A2J7PG07_9NEOP|nr:protein maelstrom homolog [Cryptotermes secundus]PNF15261.1 hypothetical protein B7P43_G01039 [Cryptotermes secundus]